MRPARGADIAGFALNGNDWDGIYVGRRKKEDLGRWTTVSTRYPLPIRVSG